MVKEIDNSMEQLKKNLKSDKLIAGTKISLKNLKMGKLQIIYLSSNCPKDIKDDVAYYANLTNTGVVELNYPNDELGTICKKPFSISVLSLLK